jgi:acyl carrier protein
MEEIIKEYIIKEFMFDNPQATLTDDQALMEDGIIDSLGIFTLIAFIEQQFGVKIDPADVVVENFQSVRKVADLVRSRSAAATQ